MTNKQAIKWFLEVLNQMDTAKEQREFSRMCVSG